VRDSYMVLEFCDGGTFEDYHVGGAAGFAEACLYFRGVVMALEYLHSWGIAHRDIKAPATSSPARFGTAPSAPRLSSRCFDPEMPVWHARARATRRVSRPSAIVPSSALCRCEW
jgi:serine/threonine protein kinase